MASIMFWADLSKDRDLPLYGHCGLGFTIRLWLDDFCEPPIADPHDGWCGEGRLITVPYPIKQLVTPRQAGSFGNENADAGGGGLLRAHAPQ
jgi:hypothetical protein